jgi:hypothetical protein
MAGTPQIAVLITLDPDARPIQGRMAVNGRGRGGFQGWLELNDRLEQILSSSMAAEELEDMVRGLRTAAGCLPRIQPARRHHQ